MFIQKIAKTTIRKEKIPRIADIVNIKKSRIQSEIERIIDEKSHTEYLKAAKNILKDNNPEEILAAIIKYSFEREFD
jgi:ATP-dependent RNA helicase DeaD